MKPFQKPQARPSVVIAALLSILCLGAGQVRAQSSCSSDEQPQPSALTERFISADCEACWRTPDAAAQSVAAGSLVLDWIVPAYPGADTLLSSAATRDSLQRLQMLGVSAPGSPVTLVQHARLALDQQLLVRVAHGLPLVNYVGASIEMTPPTAGPWVAVLLLVEDIAADTEDTPIARHLVRNMLVAPWEDLRRHGDTTQTRWLEWRAMSLPEGTRFRRLHAVGWVQNARGQIVGLARSQCAPGVEP